MGIELEQLILKEYEVEAEFESIGGVGSCNGFVQDTGPGPEEFASSQWGLEYKGWAVSYVAQWQRGSFESVPHRSPALSLIYYARRFVINYAKVHGSDPGTEQRIDQIIDDLSVKTNPDLLVRAEDLAITGWRPL